MGSAESILAGFTISLPVLKSVPLRLMEQEKMAIESEAVHRSKMHVMLDWDNKSSLQ